MLDEGLVTNTNEWVLAASITTNSQVNLEAVSFLLRVGSTGNEFKQLA
jgi:hypothetical protein